MTMRTPSATTVERSAATAKSACPEHFAVAGLYDPRKEHDSCGVGFIAQMKGIKSHEIVGMVSPCSRTSRIAAPSAPIR